MGIGPHVILPSAAAMVWARQAPIVKSIDRVDVLQAALESAIRIFRHYLPSQNTEDPVGTATAVLAALGGYRHPNLYVELWNECHPTYEQMRDAVEVCRNAGVNVAVGSWGTGDYTYGDFEAAVGACGPGDIIATHCYWGNQGFTTWNALRYCQFWQPGDPPVVITECGRDAVEDGAAGWQASGVSGEQYADELAAYATEIAKDSYVLGATVFTAGATPDWQAFSTDGITDLILSKLGVSPVSDTTTQPNLTDLEARLERVEKQNAILNHMWELFRQGKFTGADSIDGNIIAMQGGGSLKFTPSYPPKA